MSDIKLKEKIKQLEKELETTKSELASYKSAFIMRLNRNREKRTA